MSDLEIENQLVLIERKLLKIKRIIAFISDKWPTDFMVQEAKILVNKWEDKSYPKTSLTQDIDKFTNDLHKWLEANKPEM